MRILELVRGPASGVRAALDPKPHVVAAAGRALQALPALDDGSDECRHVGHEIPGRDCGHPVTAVSAFDLEL
jgi:hypothetical protein